MNLEPLEGHFEPLERQFEAACGHFLPPPLDPHPQPLDEPARLEGPSASVRALELKCFAGT